MKYLKEKFGNYLQFKNTITGKSYFLRSLSLILFAIPVGILIGIGASLIIAKMPVAGAILVLLGGLFLIPMIWFSLAITYKRINAFFPKHATLLTVLTFLFSFVMEGFNPNNGAMDIEQFVNPFTSPVYAVLLAVSLVWSLYLLFANSKIKKHIG